MSTSNLIATILSPPSIGAMSGATGVYDYYRVGHNSSVTNVDAVWTFKTPTGGTITDIAWTFTWNNTAAGTGWEGNFTYAFTLSESSEAGTLVNGLKTVTANCAGSSGSVKINFTNLQLLPNKRYYLRANYTNATSKSTMKAAASNQNLTITYVVPVLERSIITGYDKQADKYTIYAEVSNAINVYAPTWTEKDGQDEVSSEDLWLELKHYSEMGESGPWTVNGETYTYGREVKREKHKNEYGTYISQLYANHGSGADIDLNKTMYAYYTQDLIFKDSNEEETQLLPPQKINWGDELGELPIPKKAGFDFIGWTIGKENSGGGITWDGNTEGLIYGYDDALICWKISDNVPTMEEALKGGYYKLSDSNVKHPITSDMIEPYPNGDPRVYSIKDAKLNESTFTFTGMMCYVALEDHIGQDMENGLYWLSSEKGIYTADPAFFNGTHITELFLNGIHQELKEVTFVESTTKYYPTIEAIIEPEDNEDSGSVESEDLTWDGNTAGLITANYFEDTICRISGDVPTLEAAQAGGYVKISGREDKIPFTSSNVQASPFDGLYFIEISEQTDTGIRGVYILFIVTRDNFTSGGANLVTIPKKGIYVLKPKAAEDPYLTLLHIDGYKFGSGGSNTGGGSDTLTWNGEIESLTSATLDGIPIYKISSGAPSMTEAQNGGVFTTTSITTETAFTSSDVRQFSDDGLVYAMTLGSSAQLLVITKDNCEVIFDGEVVATIAEKGTYVPSPDIIPEYVTKIRIDGYYGFEGSSSSGGGPSVKNGDLTWDGETTELDVVDMGGVPVYRLSDSVPTMEQAQAGGYIKCATVDGEISFTSDNVNLINETGTLFILSVYRSEDDDFGVMLFVVTQDNLTYTEGEASVTFSKKGVYSPSPVMLGDYVAYLHIDGYEFSSGGGSVIIGSSEGSGTIEFDGNLFNKPCYGYSGGDFTGNIVMLSDAVPTLADLSAGGSAKIHTADGEEEIQFSIDDVQDLGEGALAISDAVVIAPYDGYVYGPFEIEFAGTWFIESNAVYFSSLTINGYTGFGGNGEPTLLWDGDTAGLASIEVMGMPMYKLSSYAPTMEEALKGGYYTSTDATIETFFHKSRSIMPFSDNLYVLALDSTAELFVATANNVNIEFDGELMGTIPEKGIYAIDPAVVGGHLTMLRFNGYYGFKDESSSGDSGSQIKIIRTGWDLLGTSGTLYAQWKRGGIRRRYIDGEWRKATRHRFIDGEWKQAIPYRYSDGKWRIGT